MGDSTNPPLPLEMAAGFAINAAHAMSEQTGGNYGGRAKDELERDPEFDPAGELHPARFTHEVIDGYLLAAGDYVHGTGLTTDPAHDLGFSSASLARSACEYADRCWWLADPAIDVRERIARVLAVWRNTLAEERRALPPESMNELEAVSRPLMEWARAIDPPLPKRKVPSPSDLFKKMYGDRGFVTTRCSAMRPTAAISPSYFAIGRSPTSPKPTTSSHGDAYWCRSATDLMLLAGSASCGHGRIRMHCGPPWKGRTSSLLYSMIGSCSLRKASRPTGESQFRLLPEVRSGGSQCGSGRGARVFPSAVSDSPATLLLWCHVAADVLNCPVWAEHESLDVQDASIGETDRVACDGMRLVVVGCSPPGASEDAAV